MKFLSILSICLIGFCFASEPEIYPYYFYFSADRDPVATESNIASWNLPPEYLFFWFNTTDNTYFDFRGGSNGSYVWGKRPTSLNTAAHIADASGGATTNLQTDYNALSLLTIANGLNASNTAQNDLATKYNALVVKFNTLMDHLESQNLQAY